MFQDVFDDSYSILEETLGEAATLWLDGDTLAAGIELNVVLKRSQLQGDNSRAGDGRWPDNSEGTTQRETGEITLDSSLEVRLSPSDNASGSSVVQVGGKLWRLTRRMRVVAGKTTYLANHIEFVRSRKRARRI